MGKKLIGGIIVGLVIFSLALVFILGPRGEEPPTRPDAANQIALIRIEGPIIGGAAPSFFGFGGAENITEKIYKAAEDPQIKAVVLRINSPGGSAAASQELSEAVLRLRDTGRPVVVSMGDTAASGAYWVAAQSDHIVANPATVTGSIGVIIQTQHLGGLYQMLGIETETYKSGPYKDMGATNREPTQEEQQIFQSMVDDIFEQFIAVVASGRDMPEEEVRALADGRVFTGRQAQQLRLVDELGDYKDAVRVAAEMSGIDPEQAVVVDMSRRDVFQQFRFGLNSLVQGNHQSWFLIAPTIEQR